MNKYNGHESKKKNQHTIYQAAFSLLLLFSLSFVFGCGDCKDRLFITFEDNLSSEAGDYTVRIKKKLAQEKKSCTFTIRIDKMNIPYTELEQGCHVSFTVLSPSQFDLDILPPKLPEQVQIDIVRNKKLLLSKTIEPKYQTVNGTEGKTCQVVRVDLRRN